MDLPDPLLDFEHEAELPAKTSVLKDIAAQKIESKPDTTSQTTDPVPSDTNQSITIILQVPDQKVPNLTLTLSNKEVMSMCVEELKKKVSEEHPYKPSIKT